MDIKVMPPSINDSAVRFKIVEDTDSVDGRAIVFGLSAIKNVGVAAIEAILAAREQGPFVSFVDFCNRVDSRRVNKKVVESLIKVGALSVFGTRAGLLDSLEEVRSIAKAAQAPQQSLFGSGDTGTTPDALSQINSSVEEFEESQLQKFEKELLGFTLTGESAQDILADFQSFTTHNIDEVTEAAKLPEEVKIAGLVKNIRKVTTKNGGKEMAFGTLDDGTGELGLVIFPKTYATTKGIWDSGFPVLISGKIDHREDTPSILVNEVYTQESLKELGDAIIISIPPKTSTQAITHLEGALKKSPGMKKVVLEFSDNQKTRIPLPFTVDWTPKLEKSVDKILLS
jgi:DNA polymerase-3 subunit alpha